MGGKYMLSWLKKLVTGNKCVFCSRKTDGTRKYYNDKGKPVAVCAMCVEYAERRAYRKRR